MEANPPKSTTPILNNSPVETAKHTFHTIRLTSAELTHYPKLPQLADMINTAFTVAGLKHPGLYEAAERKRYGAPADLVDDMGPDGITFVTLATTEEQEDPEPIATTGYKPWSDVWKLAARIDGGFTVTDFPEKDKILDDVPRFEIVAVAVDPRFQLHGLASQLLVKSTKEIFEVVKVGGGSMVRLKIRTIKEINEGYWTKTGFTTLREMRFDVGTAGSLTGFSSLEMFRDHSV